MKCPSCADITLTMSERQGVEIDYCPECRGVWLDRGELDKLIEKSGTHRPAVDERHFHREKKRKSFLAELFD